MQNEEKISRRNFFKYLTYLVLIPFGIFSFSALSNKFSNKKNGIKKLSINDLSSGFNFIEGLIIVNEKNIKIFSSKCSHLGCKINSQKNGLLVCPCHGSKFDKEGNPVEGPAPNPLKEIRFEKNANSNELIVYEEET
jgi:Rieske Fe-S protein